MGLPAPIFPSGNYNGGIVVSTALDNKSDSDSGTTSRVLGSTVNRLKSEIKKIESEMGTFTSGGLKDSYSSLADRLDDLANLTVDETVSGEWTFQSPITLKNGPAWSIVADSVGLWASDISAGNSGFFLRTEAGSRFVFGEFPGGDNFNCIWMGDSTLLDGAHATIHSDGNYTYLQGATEVGFAYQGTQILTGNNHGFAIHQADVAVATGTNVLLISSGTAWTPVADSVAMWVSDFASGDARLNLQTESGFYLVFGNQTVTVPDGAANTTGNNIVLRASPGGADAGNNPFGGNVILNTGAKGTGGSGSAGYIAFRDSGGTTTASDALHIHLDGNSQTFQAAADTTAKSITFLSQYGGIVASGAGKAGGSVSWITGQASAAAGLGAGGAGGSFSITLNPGSSAAGLNQAGGSSGSFSITGTDAGSGTGSGTGGTGSGFEFTASDGGSSGSTGTGGYGGGFLINIGSGGAAGGIGGFAGTVEFNLGSGADNTNSGVGGQNSDFYIRMGDCGDSSGTNQNGRSSGRFFLVGGAGGLATGTGTGGAGSGLSFNGGAGGFSDTGTGGIGGSFGFQGGTGGETTGGTGGTGGGFTFSCGNGGNSGGTAGNGGTFVIHIGNTGVIGTPGLTGYARIATSADVQLFRFGIETSLSDPALWLDTFTSDTTYAMKHMNGTAGFGLILNSPTGQDMGFCINNTVKVSVNSSGSLNWLHAQSIAAAVIGQTVYTMTSNGARYGTIQVETEAAQGAWSLGSQAAAGSTLGTASLTWDGFGHVRIPNGVLKVRGGTYNDQNDSTTESEVQIGYDPINGIGFLNSVTWGSAWRTMQYQASGHNLMCSASATGAALYVAEAQHAAVIGGLYRDMWVLSGYDGVDSNDRRIALGTIATGSAYGAIRFGMSTITDTNWNICSRNDGTDPAVFYNTFAFGAGCYHGFRFGNTQNVSLSSFIGNYGALHLGNGSSQSPDSANWVIAALHTTDDPNTYYNVFNDGSDIGAHKWRFNNIDGAYLQYDNNTGLLTMSLHGAQAGTSTHRTVLTFADNGFGTPVAAGSDSNGDKVILWDNGSTAKYALGIGGGINGALWSQVPSGAGYSYLWYSSTQLVMSLDIVASGDYTLGLKGLNAATATDRVLIDLGANGYAAPANVTATSNGDKIQLFGNNSEHYRLGISQSTMWFQSYSQFEWWNQATTVRRMAISDTGNLHLFASSSAGGAGYTGNSLKLGYDTAADLGLIEAANFGVGWKPLAIVANSIEFYGGSFFSGRLSVDGKFSVFGSTNSPNDGNIPNLTKGISIAYNEGGSTDDDYGYIESVHNGIDWKELRVYASSFGTFLGGDAVPAFSVTRTAGGDYTVAIIGSNTSTGTDRTFFTCSANGFAVPSIIGGGSDGDKYVLFNNSGFKGAIGVEAGHQWYTVASTSSDPFHKFYNGNADSTAYCRIQMGNLPGGNTYGTIWLGSVASPGATNYAIISDNSSVTAVNCLTGAHVSLRVNNTELLNVYSDSVETYVPIGATSGTVGNFGSQTGVAAVLGFDGGADVGYLTAANFGTTYKTMRYFSANHAFYAGNSIAPVLGFEVTEASGNTYAILTNAGTGATGAQLITNHNSSSPADNDDIFILTCLANDDEANQRQVGAIACRFLDVTKTTMDSEWRFSVMDNVNAGNYNTTARLDSTGVWQDASSRAIKTYDIRNPLDIWPDVLNKIGKLDLGRYWARGISEDRARHFHLSPSAESFYELFGLSTNESIASKDMAGVAILGLLALKKEYEETIEKLSKRIQELEASSN